MERVGVLARILKNMGATVGGNVITLLTQLILPPVFIHRYGVALYGQWLALSVAVAYLATLNFGVQTYVNQDLTVRYNSGDLESYRVQQSTALRLMIYIVGVASLLSLSLFAMPLNRWLRLEISQPQAAAAAYFLALQVLISILYGFISGSFMVVGQAHRGGTWNNIQRLALIVVTVTLAWLRVSFPLLAAAQFLSYAGCLVFVLWDLHRTAPQIFPSLRYWDSSAVARILKPSGYFALIESTTFFAFQAPVIILERALGPAAVVVFALMRTLFSMCRQLVNIVTLSIAPEITNLFGKREWGALAKLYSYSERMVFAIIPTVNLGVLMLSPFLLTVWLHKRGMFSIYPYVICSAVSIVMSIKENKLQFQFSTNSHVAIAKVVFLSYVALVVVSLFAVSRWGLMGFLWTWLAVEGFQAMYVFHLNRSLFTMVGELEKKYLIRLGLLVVPGLLATAALLRFSTTLGLPSQVGLSALVILCIGSLASMAFGIPEVARDFRGRFRSKVSVG